MSSIPPLPLAEVSRRILDPAFALLPPMMDTPEARVELLAIGRQESRFLYRRQMILVPDEDGDMVLRPRGPAKSFWQGEKGGGMVHGVRLHPATRDLARKLYSTFKVKPTDAAIWNAIEENDVLAAGLARLLLWTDPKPMPRLGDWLGAWRLYLRTWRPGKPHEETWRPYYMEALALVMPQDD